MDAASSAGHRDKCELQEAPSSASPRHAFFVGAAFATAGCSSISGVGAYSVALSKAVTFGCHRGYTVYEKDNKLLVMAYPVSEVVGAACTAFTQAGSSPTSEPIRYQAAAERYLEAKERQSCRITDALVLTRFHSEFRFICTSGHQE